MISPTIGCHPCKFETKKLRGLNRASKLNLDCIIVFLIIRSSKQDRNWLCLDIIFLEGSLFPKAEGMSHSSQKGGSLLPSYLLGSSFIYSLDWRPIVWRVLVYTYVFSFLFNAAGDSATVRAATLISVIIISNKNEVFERRAEGVINAANKTAEKTLSF